MCVCPIIIKKKSIQIYREIYLIVAYIINDTHGALCVLIIKDDTLRLDSIQSQRIGEITYLSG